MTYYYILLFCLNVNISVKTSLRFRIDTFRLTIISLKLLMPIEISRRIKTVGVTVFYFNSFILALVNGTNIFLFVSSLDSGPGTIGNNVDISDYFIVYFLSQVYYCLFVHFCVSICCHFLMFD